MTKSIVAVLVAASFFISVPTFAGEKATGNSNAVATNQPARPDPSTAIASGRGGGDTSGPAKGQRRSFYQETLKECSQTASNNGKRSLEFVTGGYRFMLVSNSAYQEITLHTQLALSADEKYYTRYKPGVALNLSGKMLALSAANNPTIAIVERIFTVNGISSVYIDNSYKISMTYGKLFDDEVLIQQLCVALKTYNW